MKGSTGGLTLGQIYGEIILDNKRFLYFLDEFARAGVDTDLWSATLDGGGTWAPHLGNDSFPTCFLLFTGNVIDNDSVIVGDVLKNRNFSPSEDGFTTVTWECRMAFNSVADISAFWGLLNAVTTGYAQNMTRACHFFADVAVNVNYNCRSHNALEETTDSGVALDTAFHTFKIVWTTTSVLFYIDDVLVATHITQVNLRSAIQHFLLRTEAGATKGMFIDKVKVVVS